MICSNFNSSTIFLIFLFFLLIPLKTIAWISENRRIEQEILRNYDKRHRPVKSESTVVRVQLFLTVNHIEKVDEYEGTMLLHGILWAAWTDEYLRWTPSEHNNTFVISIEAWKIWQPTFALYNSARSNSWFVYMNGVPATVSNDGRVFAAGAFSFQVTCQFNFANFPYDVQECPIVLADWIYDLSKVNLSEAVSARSGLNSLAKPAIRLSFDPLSENVKKHVAGWEVLDTWQRLCYWGPNGYCIDTSPIGPLDNYWSLIEFGIKIKRHAPYYGLTLVFPMVLTIILTLFAFWLDNLSLAIFLYLFNIFLESICGLNLLQQLPPGDGIMPTIGIVHCWNFLLTLFALCLHCLFHFLITVLLPDVKFLPEKIKNLSLLLKRYQPNEMVLLSFDPQTFSSINEELSPSIPIEDNLELLNQLPQQQFIIEMEPIIIENDSKIQQQQPSTSTQQFEAVELEEISQPPTIEPSKPNSDPLKRTSNSKKSLLSFGSGVFRSKKVKNEKRIVTPFKGISIENDSLKLENGKNEIKEEEDKQILINTEEELNIIEENDETKIGKKLIKKIKEEKTPLEKELTIIRQLIFYFYLIVSIILIFVLIF